MVNYDLVGGLRSALERGEPLKRAMISLFNSGYKKEEIEEAARNLNATPVMGIAQPKTPLAISTPAAKPSPVVETKKIIYEEPRPVKEVKPKPVAAVEETPKVKKESFFKKLLNPEEPRSVPVKYPKLQEAPVVQRVSSYEKPPKDDKAVITMLTIILIFLLSVLVTIFIFKNEIINFFSNMLS
jgi:hypothetical protein